MVGLKAGKYDRRIRIYFPTYMQNAEGETLTTYPPANAIDTWADVGQPYAREVVKNNQTVQIIAYEVRIRWRPNVTAACKLAYRGKTLEVASVLGENDRQVEIQMVAFEKLPQAGV